MTSHVTEGQKPDLYGQVHPVETPDLIKSSLVAMKEILDQFPEDQTTNVNLAQDKCPFLVKDDFKLTFLRCEVFNADLAAKRYVHYWDKRVELFGEKAFLPLTLDGALQDDAVALGFGGLVPMGKDATGRAIIYSDPSKQDPKQYTRESMCRAVWYTLHAAIEDTEAQQRGLVFITYKFITKMSQFDHKLVKMNIEQLKGCIPVRLSAVHLCYLPPSIQLILPIIKVFMGERLRKRIQLHSGKKEKFLANIGAFGLPKDVIPVDIGGEAIIDQDAWLESRRVAEM